MNVTCMPMPLFSILTGWTLTKAIMLALTLWIDPTAVDIAPYCPIVQNAPVVILVPAPTPFKTNPDGLTPFQAEIARQANAQEGLPQK